MTRQSSQTPRTIYGREDKASLQEITAALTAADPAGKAYCYEEKGVDITYHRDGGRRRIPVACI